MTAIYGTKLVEPGRSPGGKEENTGEASKFSDKLIIGLVELSSRYPVKFASPSKGPMLAEECASGPRVITLLPKSAPAALIALTVIEADCVVEGLPMATPVAVWAKVANSVVGAVSAFTLASATAVPDW